METISVIVPTWGCISLADTLRSLAGQLHAEDEVILVHGRDDEQPRRIAAAAGIAVRHVSQSDTNSSGWGFAVLACGVREARAKWIHIIGEDCVYFPSALDGIRLALNENSPVIFRMVCEGEARNVLWKQKAFRYGNVLGPMLVFPNDPSRFGTFPDCPDGDWHFAGQLLHNYGGRCRWSTREIVLKREKPREEFTIKRGGRALLLRDLGYRRERLFSKIPKVGLIVGTFAAFPYIHLQLEARRRLYPDIPMLVHDDGSPAAEKLAQLCDSYGTEFECNSTRLPGHKGDLSVFVGGLAWAKERGVDLVVKFSRRWISRIRWVDELVRLAEESQYATYSNWTTSYNFGFRTECLAMAVDEWYRLGLVDKIIAAMVSPNGVFVEGLIHNLAQEAARENCTTATAYDARGGERSPDRRGYALWDFMTRDRRTTGFDFVWHDTAGASAYAALATRWGLRYENKDFADPNMGFGNYPSTLPFVREKAPPAPSVALKTNSPRTIVYTICYNEKDILPSFLRHYHWAERIVVYDDQSTDSSREIVRNCRHAELRIFDGGGMLDNQLLTEIKNHCWKNAKGRGYDYVIVVDVDEFLWFEDGLSGIGRLLDEGVTLVRPEGYDMVGERMPDSGTRLVDQVSKGFANSKYSKPCMFSPDKITEIDFSPGCHDCRPSGDVVESANHGAKLLHFRYFCERGFVERSRVRRERRSARDVQHGWGCHYDRSDQGFREEYRSAFERAAPVLPEFVIARYDEQLEWTETLPGKVTIYNKGDAHPRETKRLENCGRESHTYLSHIVANYGSLAPSTVFSQGRPLDHAQMQRLCMPQNGSHFSFLTKEEFECEWDGAPHHPGLPIAAVWERLFPARGRPARLKFGPGAIFRVSDLAIKRHNLAFYEKALDLHAKVASAPWVFERLWYYIFTE